MQEKDTRSLISIRLITSNRVNPKQRVETQLTLKFDRSNYFIKLLNT